MSSVLEKIKTLAAKKSASSKAALDSLVLKAANGDEVDPAKAVAVLDDAGVSPDEFAALVATRMERVRLRAIADAGLVAESRLNEAREKLADLERRREAAERQFDDEGCPLEFAKKEAARQLGEAQQAVGQLRATYTGPARERYAAVMKQIDAVTRKLDYARKTADEYRIAADEEAPHGTVHTPDRRPTMVARAERWEADAAALAKELAGLQAEAGRVSREFEQI